MPESENFHVSVIVPCRNEIRFIGGFLDSVIRQELDGMNVEVLIADGMSDDGTRLVLQQYESSFPALRVLDNPQRIASTGLNVAIREAKGEIIIRMDAHSDYAPDYIRNCVRTLNETGAENVGGPALTRAKGYLAQSIALAYHSRFARGGEKSQDPSYEGFVDTVTYGCWRKSTLERIGMFDETLHRNQDCDLNRRIMSSGGKIWQSPRITSWYLPRTSLSSLSHQYFQYGFWKVTVIRKHGKPASWRHLTPVISLLLAVGILFGAVASSVGGFDWWQSLFVTCGAALAGLYFMASAIAAFLLAKRDGWRFIPILPVVFSTYHLSYALGFLLGLAYQPASWDQPSPLRNALTSITR